MHPQPPSGWRPAPTQASRPGSQTLWVWVPLISAGLLAWLAPVQAYLKTRETKYRQLAVAFACGALLLVVLLAVDSAVNPGASESGETSALGSVGGFVALVQIVGGLVVAHQLRDVVFPPAFTPRPAGWAPQSAGDPVVAAALAARAQRQEARRLAERDPALARELRIGRPDLPRSYYDGGLVDLNHAPAEALVRELQLSAEHAQELVTARQRIDGFTSLGEIPGMTTLSQRQVDALADRAVLLP